MQNPKNAMDVFKLLERSNCRECGMKTCLAFAGAVYTGQKKLDECTRLSADIVNELRDCSETSGAGEVNNEEFLNDLKKGIQETDLSVAAEKAGGVFSGGKLTLKILGKNFSVDSIGNLSSDIHINPWVAGPFLDYIINTDGVPISSEWVSLRDLKEGRELYPLFRKRCEEPMKRVADIYTDLFDIMVQIFGGNKVAEEFQSDISVVLHPLPKVPVMICYWKSDDGLDSSLNVFFDKTAERNLGTNSVFTIGVGLAQMFENLAKRHGFK